MSQNEYNIEWKCNQHVFRQPMSWAQIQFCHDTAMQVVKYSAGIKEGTTIRFRCGVHRETRETTFLNDGSKSTRIIPDVPHYTAEYQIPKTDRWVTFHLYVKVLARQRKFDRYVTPRGEPNPVIYFDREGPSQMEGYDDVGQYFDYL